MTQTRWVIGSKITAEAQAALRDYHPLVAQMLFNRGVNEAEPARWFFEGKSALPEDPLLLTGMAAAVDRLRHAIRTGQHIVVYGDYDTDGVTATALLVQVLGALGAAVDRYIPDREEEGYGLNSDALGKIQTAGGQVVITVDCGVRALDEARQAGVLGLDLIITDHHEPGEELPEALALINPNCCESCGLRATKIIKLMASGSTSAASPVHSGSRERSALRTSIQIMSVCSCMWPASVVPAHP